MAGFNRIRHVETGSVNGFTVVTRRNDKLSGYIYQLE